MAGHKNSVVDYPQIALQARHKVLEMIFKAATSHAGSNLSVIDIASVLYEKANLESDKVIWSAGWKAATAYYFLARKGIIPTQDLATYCQKITCNKCNGTGYQK